MKTLRVRHCIVLVAHTLMAISYIPDAQRKLIRIDVSCLHIAYVFTSRLFLHCIYKMHATNGPVT